MTNRPYLNSIFRTKQGALIAIQFAGHNLRSLTMARKPFNSIVYFYGLNVRRKGRALAIVYGSGWHGHFDRPETPLPSLLDALMP
jgi:hypothetical protein